ncbi:hypothetical protein Bpfe_001796 [Biomphalaria pfeifferi]|uniref:Uncharacterized protein n=1 Tax=Biomphalaria pfeifferi TaxID=112525 RepID=A0AAD8C9Z1_BIOPF|nr:hypothetical protein Bpfe_001796 [Biomphalaria pfeifferi]
MVSQVDSLVKEQLPVDSLVKKLRGQDCGCTNSGDGDAGNWSAVCVCVVGKSCGCDFQDEKRDNDCCDDLFSFKGVCQEALQKQRARATAVLRKTGLDTISLCVKRPRHRLNNSLINWRKRKRHQRKTVRMPSWGTRSLPPVTPTDRPPPELSNLYYIVSFRDEKC